MAKITQMTDKMHALLAYLYEDKEAYREIPDDVSKVTIKNLERKDWIVTDDRIQMAKITGRGLVALRTARIYPNTKTSPGLGTPSPYDGRGETNGANNGVIVHDLHCDDCLDCDAAQILERLKGLDPRIKKVVDAWANAKAAEREFVR